VNEFCQKFTVDGQLSSFDISNVRSTWHDASDLHRIRTDLGFPDAYDSTFNAGNPTLVLVSRNFQCNGKGCSWTVRYEKSLQGWVLVLFSPHSSTLVDVTLSDGSTAKQQVACKHGHFCELKSSLLQVRAARGGQTKTDPKMEELGDIMANAKVSAALIKRVIDSYNADNDIDTTTYDYDYVYRRFYSTTHSEEWLDLTNLVDHLQERYDLKGLDFEFRVDRLGCAEAFFVVLTNGMTTWAQTDGNVVLFDPTHGTNLHGMKLCCFVTVGADGRNAILAIVLVATETRELFEWAFRCFAKTFRTAPALLVTDGDGEILAACVTVSAVGEIWGGCRHHLCVYHISKNVYQHLRKLFGANMAEWHKTMNEFWRMAKATDVTCIGTFYEEFDAFVDNVKVVCHASEGLQKELDWLHTNLRMTAPKWAARFVWGICTYGIHATQRAESTQDQVKGGLSGRTTCCELIDHTENLNARNSEQNAVKELREDVRTQKQSQESIGIIQFLRGYVSPFALKLLLLQEKQSFSYQSCPIEDYVDADGVALTPNGRYR
jgi:hypothetical protein